MFENYFNRLRFSQKMTDRSLVTCMKIMESCRNFIKSDINDKKVYCHKGCNLCCHALTIAADPINTYILTRILSTIPYDELFPYFKTCAENRIISQNYIDSLPLEYNNNIIMEVYNKYGFTPFTCPFVDNQNGCLIYNFRPQPCFTYFSSELCKIIFNPILNENQKEINDQIKNRAETIDTCGLENDHENYNFNDFILKSFAKIDQKTINQDKILDYILTHSCSYEMLTILSIALEFSDTEKYNNFKKGIKIDLQAQMDGKIVYL